MAMYTLEYSENECLSLCIAETILQCRGCNFTSNERAEKSRECARQCPQKCESETFNYRLGFLQFPPQDYFELNKNFSAEFQSNHSFLKLRVSVLKLTMRYDELSYTLIYKEPKFTIDSLIGTFGGTLGCFIGASLISLVELFQFVFFVSIAVFKRICKNVVRKLGAVKKRAKVEANLNI